MSNILSKVLTGANKTSSFLPDEPIDDASRFGFDVYSEALTELIKSKELQTPFTIAIHGDWGSGKTSLMKTVCKTVEKKNDEDVKLRTIWFDAWEFERLSIPLWKVFLNRIMCKMTEFVKEEGKKDLRDRLKQVGEGFLLLSSDAILKKIIGISLDEIKKVKEKVGNDIKEIDSLREDLSKCIEEVLKNDSSGAQRIVIFIDDLDRCLPEHCVEVFESIKLFLSSENCVFIIGVNKEQICKAFQNKFGKGGPSGLHYMEKFIQLQFDLPRKNPIEVQSFLTDFATKKLKENPKTIELIASFIEPNPRKVKRWLNSVIFLEELFKIRQKQQVIRTEIDVSLVSIWLFIKSFFPDFAQLVESSPSLLNSAIRVANGVGTDEDKRKIADYVMDKRLTSFFATLKPNYDENQLKDIVYLSKLTPIQQVSIVPSEMLKRIQEIPEEELTEQLNRLTDYGLIGLIDRIVEKLSAINNYDEYEKNIKTFELLDSIIKKIKDDANKVILFQKILDFVEGSTFAYNYFLSKLSTYAAWNPIKKMIVETEGYLDRTIKIFSESNSFNDAKISSEILVNFIDDFDKSQIRSIVKSFLDNGQINYSWGAKRNLKQIFNKHSEWIQPEQIDKIKEYMRLDA